MITGVVCGVRIENIEEPVMREIRYLSKMIDELAKGKAMNKVLRTKAAYRARADANRTDYCQIAVEGKAFPCGRAKVSADPFCGEPPQLPPRVREWRGFP